MSFTYNSSIPAANNNPSDDQPIMQQNAFAISNFVNVDHVSFNNANCGKHLQVTFNSKNTPGAQTDPQSVIYTANGLATTISQLKYVNQSGTFPLSTLRAYAYFSAGTLFLNTTNYFNVNTGGITVSATISQVTYTIPLTTGATASNDVGIIFVSPQTNGLFWTIAGNVITLKIAASTAAAGFVTTMLVYQL